MHIDFIPWMPSHDSESKAFKINIQNTIKLNTLSDTFILFFLFYFNYIVLYLFILNLHIVFIVKEMQMSFKDLLKIHHFLVLNTHLKPLMQSWPLFYL